MRANYQNCLAITAKWEGHISDHPKDPGGLTNRGVTQAVYDKYREDKDLVKRSVRYLTEVEYQAIYKNNYWDAIRGDGLPMGLDGLAFDGAVNSGPSRGAKWLQGAIGAVVDGKVGTETLRKANEVYANGIRAAIGACKRAIELRTSFLRGLSTFATFGRGWMNRVADWEVKAVLMVQSAFGGDATKLDPVIAQREREAAEEAARKAGQRSTASGAGGTAGAGTTGGSAASPVDPSDQLAGLSDGTLWGLTALILLAGLFGVYLWWRKRRLHQARAEAYASASK